MMNVCLVTWALLLLLLLQGSHSWHDQHKFILYDVNPGEGFNLRRDVFVRLAVLVHRLNLEKSKFAFTLVLPPWGPLYHWQSPPQATQGPQVGLPWRSFFNLSDINRFVSVVDLDHLIQEDEPLTLDECLVLQSYAEGWKDGVFEEKFDFRPCLQPNPIDYDVKEKFYYNIFRSPYDTRVRAKRSGCLSIQGTTDVIKDFLKDTQFRYLYLGRAENLLHEDFGGLHYWQARRSMRFQMRLTQLADAFRRRWLDSNDIDDNTRKSEKWEEQKPDREVGRGGQYMCLHMRRRDYVRSRQGQIPHRVEDAARQMVSKMDKLELTKLFLATDAPEEEVDTFRDVMAKRGLEVFSFMPTNMELKEIKDGGVAIVDQIICSHAKHFVGSAESTFTFRIQEEREMMGFSVDSTFDILCPSNENKVERKNNKNDDQECKRSNVWKIVYETQRDEL